MKYLVVLACVVVAAVASNLPNLPEGERLKLAQVHRDCQADPKTHVDEDKLRKLPNFVEDKQVGVHMRCMVVKAGLMKQNGKLDVPSITEKFRLVIKDASKVNALVQQCAVDSETPEKTSILFTLCCVKNDIQYYHKL
ncbi:uncharacterized protein LOC114335043 [Diabrotica virgifera virgifera]|uniref:Uncharacterized protein LOC114335043 isoform X1 n=1 Tax=Diabrotica virgifera virgifera TaxID=50390 RepID=A0A6P7G831_DIAVI|nr:uncharacterized protein LOC114335043 [Diabrotica virgifera virgifera]